MIFRTCPDNFNFGKRNDKTIWRGASTPFHKKDAAAIGAKLETSLRLINVSYKIINK